MLLLLLLFQLPLCLVNIHEPIHWSTNRCPRVFVFCFTVLTQEVLSSHIFLRYLMVQLHHFSLHILMILHILIILHVLLWIVIFLNHNCIVIITKLVTVLFLSLLLLLLLLTTLGIIHHLAWWLAILVHLLGIVRIHLRSYLLIWWRKYLRLELLVLRCMEPLIKLLWLEVIVLRLGCCWHKLHNTCIH